MKMLKTFVAVLVLTATSYGSLIAATTEGPSPREALRDRVISLLSNHYYSSLETGEELEVKLTFMVNKKNEIVVIDVDAADQNIQETIIGSLNYKNAKVENATTSIPYYIDITIQGRS